MDGLCRVTKGENDSTTVVRGKWMKNIFMKKICCAIPKQNGTGVGKMLIMKIPI